MALNIQRKWTTIKLFSRLKLVEKAKVVFRLHGVVSAFKIIHFTPFCFRSVECKNVYMFGGFFSYRTRFRNKLFLYVFYMEKKYLIRRTTKWS